MTAHPLGNALYMSAYYRKTQGRPARELLRGLLLRLEAEGIPPGDALDLGCGSGNESLALLERGWNVLAVDKEAAAIEILLERVPPAQRPRLRTEVADFEHAQLAPCDLIWSAQALPFCPPAQFSRVWTRILAALRPGAWLACDFFGRDNFMRHKTALSTHTLSDVRRLVASLELEYLVHERGRRLSPLCGVQPWQSISVIARKPRRVSTGGIR
jgi:trans-aconitate methyltransferase